MICPSRDRELGINILAHINLLSGCACVKGMWNQTSCVCEKSIQKLT